MSCSWSLCIPEAAPGSPNDWLLSQCSFVSLNRLPVHLDPSGITLRHPGTGAFIANCKKLGWQGRSHNDAVVSPKQSWFGYKKVKGKTQRLPTPMLTVSSLVPHCEEGGRHSTSLDHRYFMSCSLHYFRSLWFS